MSRIQVFDRNGVMIAEFEATCNRSWLLSDVGKAQLDLSVFDAKCRREYLEFGNLVLVEHEKLPAWGGVIDTPRTWYGNGAVSVQAYSAEKLLSYRIAPLNITLKGTAGEIVRQMLQLAQADDTLPIVEGQIDVGGTQRQETLNVSVILEEMQRVAKRAGGEFTVIPVVTRGILSFELSYYTSIGRETGFGLEEGHNLELTSRVLVEQGNLVNDLVGYGDGASWTSRPTQRVIDEGSIGLYGRRQGAKNFSGNVIEGTLLDNSVKYVEQRKQPRMTFDLSALNVGETWSWLRPGNVLKMRLFSVGFNGDSFGYTGDVLVRGMEFNEEKNTVRIICEDDNEYGD